MQPTKIDDQSLLAPSRLGKIELYHMNKEFLIKQNEHLVPVKNHRLDKELYGISSDVLKAYLMRGAYLQIKQSQEGKYGIKIQGRLKGGGPILGKAAYWFRYIGTEVVLELGKQAIIAAISSTLDGGSSSSQPSSTEELKSSVTIPLNLNKTSSNSSSLGMPVHTHVNAQFSIPSSDYVYSEEWGCMVLKILQFRG